jgi:hypothetical protein
MRMKYPDWVPKTEKQPLQSIAIQILAILTQTMLMAA